MTQYHVTQLEDYEPLIGRENVERIREKARRFKGLRVVNFNSTYYGGGVAEMLSSLTLLLNSLGLQAEWRVIAGTPDFFQSPRKCTTRCKVEKSIYRASKRRFLNRSPLRTACADPEGAKIFEALRACQ